MRFLFCLLVILAGFLPFAAQAAEKDAFRATPYPLPRFVSLGSDEVFVRAGPGTRYPVKWVYQKKKLPLEVILEFDAWRKVRDHEGQSGWVHQSLLSGKRTALIHGVENAPLYRRAKTDARIIARIEPSVVGHLHACEKGWCAFEAEGYKGWLQRKYIWGIYENEIFD